MSTNNSTGTPDISGNNTSQVSATNNKVILNVSNNTMSSNITANSNNNQNLNTSNLPKTIIHTGVKLNAFSPISASNNLSPSKVASIQSPIALLSNQSINTSQTTNIITTTAPINTSNTSTTNNNNSSSGGTGSNNANNSNNANTNSYGGFAHCSNCGEIGVKDAFYGKSKLYCSVACQSGIKKQQQSQGTKRTIDSLNYSSCSSVNNSPVLQAPQLVNLPTSSQNIVKSSAPLQQIQTNSTNQSAALYQNNESNLNSSLVPTVISTLNKNDYITMNKSSNQVTNQLNSNLNTKLIYQENECLTSTSTLSSHTTSSSMHNGNASKRARNGSNVSATSTIKNLTDQQNLLSIQKINDDENKKTDSKASANFDSEKSLSPQKKHFDWPSYLEKGNFEAAPVKLFKHAPIHSFFEKSLNEINCRSTIFRPETIGLNSKFRNLLVCYCNSICWVFSETSLRRL